MTEARMNVRGREVRYIVEEDDRILVDSPEQIPHRETEAEEQAFWKTHDFSERYIRNHRLPREDGSAKKLARKQQKTGR